MGQMFRASWQPALLAEELPENECPPVRVKLLGARLLAWRDTNGKLAPTDERGRKGSAAGAAAH
jgi:phenylpropionate dioxygenase-like ring-hydroxylating dioxygenase large terminal subunit